LRYPHRIDGSFGVANLVADKWTTAPVGCNQQGGRLAIPFPPPMPDAFHCKLHSIMVIAHADPSAVGRHIVDTIQLTLAQFAINEVIPDLLRLALGLPLTTSILEIADQLLFLIPGCFENIDTIVHMS